MLVVQGELQNEMNVIHVIARKMRDYSHWLGRVPTESGSLQLRHGEKCCKGAPAGSRWEMVNIRRSSPRRAKTHG
jgi:hypothetical protein